MLYVLSGCCWCGVADCDLESGTWSLNGGIVALLKAGWSVLDVF